MTLIKGGIENNNNNNNNKLLKPSKLNILFTPNIGQDISEIKEYFKKLKNKKLEGDEKKNMILYINNSLKGIFKESDNEYLDITSFFNIKDNSNLTVKKEDDKCLINNINGNHLYRSIQKNGLINVKIKIGEKKEYEINDIGRVEDVYGNAFDNETMKKMKKMKNIVKNTEEAYDLLEVVIPEEGHLIKNPIYKDIKFTYITNNQIVVEYTKGKNKYKYTLTKEHGLDMNLKTDIRYTSKKEKI